MTSRVEAVHETIQEAIHTVMGKTFDPDDILAWEQEEGFRHYLREHNVAMGTRRPATPRTRERLRKEFLKDSKVYYKKLKPLKKAIYKAFTSDEFKNKRAWKLIPADGVEPLCPIGNPSQFEVGNAFMRYGYGKPWNNYVFPGKKNWWKEYKAMEDPWHKPWEMGEILRLHMEREKLRREEEEDDEMGIMMGSDSEDSS